jgi:hypothetical protein
MYGFLRDIFSAKDDSWELASILGFVAFCAYIYFSYHHYISLGKDFDPQAFGLGAGGLATGTGAHKLMSGKADNP